MTQRNEQTPRDGNPIPGAPVRNQDWEALHSNRAPVTVENAENTDHSQPYPEAPEVDHSDETQEHYRGARDPELAKPVARTTRY